MQARSIRWNTTEGVWWWTAALLAVLFGLTVLAYLIDARTIDGVSVWSKPLKFQLSLAVHFATLALIVSGLSTSWQQSSSLWVAAVASVVATAFEITYIMAQAALEQHSHFNVGTPFHAGMYVLMAIGAVLILAAAGMTGLAAAIDAAATMRKPLRHSIALGLIGGTVLTLVVAFTMGSRMTHHVGVVPADARALPLTGWSLSVGDLRVPHFLATHLIQAAPLAGLLAQLLFAPTFALLAVWLFAAAWTALTLATYLQALAGLPFIVVGGS